MISKHLPLLICLFGIALNISPLHAQNPEINVTGLECNYQAAPLGIDDAHPQFSWRIVSNTENTMQTAYQILVSSSRELLSADEGDVWDSGKQLSAKSAGVTYDGKELKSRRKYYWKVRMWTDKKTVTDWSEPAFFEMGLLNERDWVGGWIGYAGGMPGRVLYFKNTFAPGKKVKEARVYIAGLGFYELEINHKKVGNHVLDPAQSTYSKHIYYATYDVSDCFNAAEPNTIVVTVAPGWYGTPRLRFQMHALLEDESEILVTSNELRAITTGPTMYSSVYDGERFDAREENPETYKPSYPQGLMNKLWGFAYNTDEPVGRMVSQQVEPIEIVETLTPVSIREPAHHIYVADAGRNLAGWAALRVSGMSGRKVTLRFAETLSDNGLVNQDNLRNAKAEDSFILDSDEPQFWEPKFTYHGFRYVQIEGLDKAPGKEDLKIKVVRTAVQRTGHFSCSNQLLNDIYRMVVNTESANLHSIPTDCPQRDERMGWLNDLTARIDQEIYTFNMARFYPKFFLDVVDTQDENGTITCAAPFRFGARPADPVCVSFLLMAYKSYQFYGNAQLIRKHFDDMKAWIDYLYSRTNNGIVDYSYYGDWCPPDAFAVTPGSAVSRDTPGLFMSTGYLYYGATLLSEMAKVTGRSADASRYASMAAEIAIAFNREYWNESTGGYASNNQASNSFALFLGIVPKDKIQRVVDNLAADVKAHGYHLTTGNLCTKYLLEQLTEHGHAEEAYRIATQTTYPSWGFMLANGATTLWERWEYLTGDAMNSHNHPMMGSVGSWLYKYVVGINPDFDHPAFEHFTIRPYIFTEMDFAEGELKTVKGTIRSAWKKKGHTLMLEVTIPANSRATVVLPSAKGDIVHEVGSGEHRFKSILK